MKIFINRILSSIKDEFEKTSQQNEYGEKIFEFNQKKKVRTNGSVFIQSLIFMLIVSALFFYISLPIINYAHISFYFFLGVITLSFIGFSSFLENVKNVNDKTSKAFRKILISILGASLIFYGFAFLISSQVFNAKRYSNLIDKQEGIFKDDVKPINFNQIPVVDKTTAERLGSRKLGEIGGDLVSQYDIDPTYPQINIKGKPYRVTPLTYSGLVKWFVNQSKGLGYYISVDMASQDTKLVKLEKPIFYSFSDKLNRNIKRHIRLKRPTYIIGEINFEIDDEGNPFWVASVLKPTINLVGGMDVNKVLIIDANSGEIKEHDKKDVPAWIDRVYPAEMIEEQLVFNGVYKKGFINRYIKQTGVTKPTKGYNYLSIGEDIYFYTGITSVLSDKSNIGFVLVNMRTKETKFYPVSSAEEFSVMESARGSVQEKGYTSTFPILINLNNRPTYFMSLKDGAELTKLFALIDAQKYQNVAVGSDINETVKNYNKLNADLIDPNAENNSSVERTIKEIKAVNIEGNTFFYFTTKEDNLIYIAGVSISNDLIFAKENDKFKISGYKNDDGTFNVTGVKK